jgi:peptidoglycan/xylan/chitin deacetylase (PgdA/CDA1 family)
MRHRLSHTRVDRWTTLRLVQPFTRLIQARWPSSNDALPILMHHSIGDAVDMDVHPYLQTVTTPRTFLAQMTSLHRQGYQAMSLTEALLAQSKSRALGNSVGNVVALTFDDGFQDFLTHAFPVLDQLGFSATVFLPTAYIGKSFTGRQCLNATEIRFLSRRGIEFGSHSASHGRLIDLPTNVLRAELALSKHCVEQIVERTVTAFSYPYRFPEENTHFTAMLAKLLLESGYRSCVTTAIGRSAKDENPWCLPRLPINENDDDALFNAKLLGHYDWLRPAQLLRKRSRTWFQRTRPA